MSETEVRVVLADALVIGPDDRLLIHIRGSVFDQAAIHELDQAVKRLGLGDRVLAVFGDLELAKVTTAA